MITAMIALQLLCHCLLKKPKSGWTRLSVQKLAEGKNIGKCHA
jgi:hypothetical protein